VVEEVVAEEDVEFEPPLPVLLVSELLVVFEVVVPLSDGPPTVNMSDELQPATLTSAAAIDEIPAAPTK